MRDILFHVTFIIIFHLQKLRGRLPELTQLEGRLTGRMKTSRSEIRAMGSKIENIERMLTNIIKDYKASKAESEDSGEPKSKSSGTGGSDTTMAHPSPARPKPPPARQPSTIDIVPLPAQYSSPPQALPPIYPSGRLAGEAQGLDRDEDEGDLSETSA